LSHTPQCDLGEDFSEIGLLRQLVEVEVEVEGEFVHPVTYNKQLTWQDFHGDSNVLFTLFTTRIPFNQWETLMVTAAATDDSEDANEWPLNHYIMQKLVYDRDNSLQWHYTD
jgi:hypothetical protein